MEQQEEKVLNLATVVFLKKNNKILLARKVDKIGKGKLNGYGGGTEQNESITACATRELKEESGGVLTTSEDLEKIAIVHFHNTKSDGSIFVLTVHFYITCSWYGEPQETSEMKEPAWYSISDLPVNDMMPSDREWLPLALQGKKLIAHAYLSPFQKEKTRKTKITFVSTFAK